MEYKEWFSQALRDFDTAKYNIEGARFESGAFFLQQSAEKALKSVYIKKFKTLLKTHDLVLLAKKLHAPEKIIGYCRDLNPAYSYTRYRIYPNWKTWNQKFLI